MKARILFWSTTSALNRKVLGSLLGGWRAHRFGRQATRFNGGIRCVVSAVGGAFAWNIEHPRIPHPTLGYHFA